MTKRERLVRLYQERRAEGLCVDCGRVEVEHARYRPCRVKRSAYSVAYNRRKKAA